MATERRPTQRERKDSYLAARAMGGSVNMAAAAADIPRTTAYTWLQDDAFRLEDEAAFEKGKLELVEIIKRASIDDWRAAKALLDRNAPVDAKIEVSGGASPVKVEATVVPDGESLRAIALAIASQPAAQERDEDEESG